MFTQLSSELVRFLVFGFIGVFNSLFDTILWRILVWYIEKYPNFISFFHKRFNINQYAIAQTISFLISAVMSYILNKTFTFSDASSSADIWQILRFSLVTIISLTISVIAMNFLTENNTVLKHSRSVLFISRHWLITAKLLTIIVTMATNFIGYKLFVFA